MKHERKPITPPSHVEAQEPTYTAFQHDVLRGYEQWLAGDVSPQDEVMARIRRRLLSRS